MRFKKMHAENIDETKASARSSTTARFGAFSGYSILLADDDLLSQKLGVALLKQVGASVTVAGNGAEVLDALGDTHFDCVLMDMQMPGMCGLDATRKIRKNQRHAGLLIIALTGNIQQDDIQLCHAAGIDDVIPKPYLPEQLYSKLRKWLQADRHGDRSEPEAPVRFGAEFFDRSMLERMLGNDPAKIRQFADRFIETSRLGMDEIDGALACCDAARLGALGHRSKSPARMAGANGYADLCQMLEDAGKDGNLSRCRHIATQMRDALDRVESEFQILGVTDRGEPS